MESLLILTKFRSLKCKDISMLRFVLLTFVVSFLVGCGSGSEGKVVEPKAPENAPKLQPKAAGGAGAPKGASQ